MAVLIGTNNALIAAGKKISGGEINGRVKVLHESYKFLAEAAVNDEISGPSLPAGAKVLDAYITSPTLGATGIFSLGNRATLGENKSVIAEDADSFVASADAGGQAVMARAGISGKEAGILVRYNGGQETETFLTCTEATLAAEGETIDYVIEFTLN